MQNFDLIESYSLSNLISSYSLANKSYKSIRTYPKQTDPPSSAIQYSLWVRLNCTANNKLYWSQYNTNNPNKTL